MCVYDAKKSAAMHRRQFLQTLGGSALGTQLGLFGPVAGESAAQQTAPEIPKRDVPEVRVVFLRPKEEYWLGWPGTAFDVPGHRKDYIAKMRRFGKELGLKMDITETPLYTNDDVATFVNEINEKKPDAVVVVPLHMDRWPQVNNIVKAGLPTIIFAGLGICFTGHIQSISRQPKVYLISTADFDLEAVRYGLNMVKTRQKMRDLRVLVMRGGDTREQKIENLESTLKFVPRRVFPEEFNSTPDTDEVKAIAEDYRKRAKKIVEPSWRDILNGAKCYVVSKKLMERYDCNAITNDCLGLIHAREMPTGPCLAWSKLLDEGVSAACEADIDASLSHALVCSLLERPGFQQDPVPETEKNTFIGAHCTCATRLFGYDKPREPFILRSHSESDIGLALQVLWREGQEMTIAEFVGPKRMIIGHGRVIRNNETPPAGGCRTSVELEIDGPPDTRDTKGFHQIFTYGNHVRKLKAYCQMYDIAAEHI
jgi:hypothetical protein